ncbi:hypothetical protein Syun_030896 [Stephania yunnanensis]|uniref:Uncharacterized protein n=1 Tax=Stephania yunnanensis TaxID=152371 RepID=A0AAP0DYJ4_9MAGN
MDPTYTTSFHHGETSFHHEEQHTNNQKKYDKGPSEISNLYKAAHAQDVNNGITRKL